MKDRVRKITFWIFLISLLYYVILLGYAVSLTFRGLDSGWAMPAMSSHEKVYGAEAFLGGIVIGILATAEIFWFIPLYQILYLTASGIRKIAGRIRHAHDTADR